MDGGDGLGWDGLDWIGLDGMDGEMELALLKTQVKILLLRKFPYLNAIEKTSKEETNCRVCWTLCILQVIRKYVLQLIFIMTSINS